MKQGGKLGGRGRGGVWGKVVGGGERRDVWGKWGEEGGGRGGGGECR